MGNVANPHPGTPVGATADSGFRALYEEHYEFLVSLAMRKYDVPRDEAATLTHDVFLNFYTSRRPIEQARAYLTVGVCRACSEYWRKRSREETHAEPSTGSSGDTSEDSLVTRLTIQAALRLLKDRCRDTLQLYFVEGCTAKEVAVELGTTRRYAEKLIRNCLGKLRLIYSDLTEN